MSKFSYGHIFIYMSFSGYRIQEDNTVVCVFKCTSSNGCCTYCRL